MKAMGIARIAVATLLLGATAAPLSAQTAFRPGFYVSGSAGISNLSDTDFHQTSTAASATRVEFDTGFTGAAAVGYRFTNLFRGEVEVSVRRSITEGYTLDGVVVEGNDTHVTTGALMANGYFEFSVPQIPGLRPYGAVGFGPSLVWVDEFTVNGTSQGGGNELLFAFQGIAGLGYSISDAVTLQAEYRFFRTQEVGLDGQPDNSSTGDNANQMENQSHNLLIGVRYDF